MRLAIVRGTDGVVVNVIAAAAASWNPGPGYVAIPSDTAGPGNVYDSLTASFGPAPVPLDAARAAKVAAIDATAAALLARGAPYGGRYVDTSDRGRTDLGAVALTAALVSTGTLPAWPDSYARGWIAQDNSRIPLPTPADGIALAATVAGWYAELVQFARDQKDAALASADPASLAIDWSGFGPPVVTGG